MMNKSSLQALLAVAAISAGLSVRPSGNTRPSGLPKWARAKPTVKRMAVSASAEIQAWNEAVDKRKNERKNKWQMK